MAAMRIAFGALAIWYLSDLFPLLSDQYGPHAWLPVEQRLEVPHVGYFSLLVVFNSEEGLYVTMAAGLASALAFTLGFRTRLSGCVLWLVLVSLWNRNPTVMDGDDALLRIMIGYLTLSPCGKVWSIDAGWRQSDVVIEIWPLRLIQIQVCVLYFVSGLVKFQSPQWSDGTILQYVLVHPEYSRWKVLDFSSEPLAISLMAKLAWGIRWWELLFPLLMINRFTRSSALACGVIFHLGLLFFMRLRAFPLLMLSAYIAFLPPGWLEGLSSSYRRKPRSSSACRGD